MLLSSEKSILPFLDTLEKEIIQNDYAPTSVLRLAIKTLIRTFEYVDSVSLSGYNPESLINSLLMCQVDDHANKIDAQELIWINIQ